MFHNYVIKWVRPIFSKKLRFDSGQKLSLNLILPWFRVLWIESRTVEIRYVSLLGFIISRYQISLAKLLNMDTGNAQCRFSCGKRNLLLIIGYFTAYSKCVQGWNVCKRFCFGQLEIMLSVCILKSGRKEIAAVTSQSLSVLLPNLPELCWCEQFTVS